ncbi:unnamed protein product [Schistosoma curassoni]|uniref:Uncharacterized protein n=1 Tax=Schistosoma curassoni TaxID=6186 RepID=A0A183JU90_9TREM|nr:unnamed protein product [Schistosoma curassoni]
MRFFQFGTRQLDVRPSQSCCSLWDSNRVPFASNTENKQNLSTSTTTTNTGSSSQLLPRSPRFNRNMKLSFNNV